MAALIHIRSPRDGRYLAENGEWCMQPEIARGFRSALEAEQFCRNEQLAEVELVINRENQPPLTVRLKFNS
jgi:hypothetical protein